MPTLSHTIDTYLEAWSETDPDARDRLIQQVWTADGQLVDPPLAATGHREISAMAAALQSQFPAHAFQRASEVDEHHQQFRFAWKLVAPDGSVAISGTDVGALDEEGRISRITGFFGELEIRAA